jgi:plastocyanin
MKKLYSLIFASAFSVISANAAVINVAVSSFAFTPQTFTAVVGDQIVFTLVSGTHDVTSPMGGVPAGALPISSGTMTSPGQTYTYTVTLPGNYGYQCTIHPTTMFGGFTATGIAGIGDNVSNLLTSVYPSPFRDKVTVKYNGIEKIEFVNIVGELVKTLSIDTQEGKLDVYFDTLPAGVYFYRTYKEGAIVETRKIVKAK